MEVINLVTLFAIILTARLIMRLTMKIGEFDKEDDSSKYLNNGLDKNH